MSNCRTGCPTQDHANWGECLKASNIQMNAGDASSGMVKSGWTNKKWDAELQAFRDAKDTCYNLVDRIGSVVSDDVCKSSIYVVERS